jgi:peptide-methionine (S)-S-oxide reductase
MKSLPLPVVRFAGPWLAAWAVGVALCAGAEPGSPAMPAATKPAAPATNRTEVALLGAGCFWCTEAVLLRLEGVQSVTSGYAGGDVKNPTYEQVCTGDTGHAEVTRVVFDPAAITYAEILEVFWQLHDPTTLNRQGADVGTQYRSVIFTYSDEQRKTAEQSKAALDKSGKYAKPAVTQILPAPEFYPAEDYHKDYYNRNRNAPYCRFIIHPKLKKLGLEK